MRFLIIFFGFVFCLILKVHAGTREGATFETRGEAVIARNSAFLSSIERRDIPIPLFLDIRQDLNFSGMVHDRDSGWTKCRVPLKSELGITGIAERSFVFDCKPISYFK